MDNKTLYKNAMARLLQSDNYFEGSMDSTRELLQKAFDQDKEGLLLLMCQSVIFIESLTQIHAEYIAVIKEHGGEKLGELLDTSNEELLALSFERFLKKQKAA